VYRFLFCFILCWGLFFSAGSTSYSVSLFHDGSEIEIQWYEKQGLIINEQVCFNYKNERMKYKECRKKASTYFADECEFYTDKIEKTQKKYQDLYEGEKNKFCSASETYTP